MTSYKFSQEELSQFSRYVYETFQDIAVTSHMIHWRRHGCLLEETVKTTGIKMCGEPFSQYIVGSQSEGSTTDGMNSDTDYFYSHCDHLVVLEEKEWRWGKWNLLAFEDEETPPQFYKLRRMEHDRLGYVTEPLLSTDVVDDQGRVLMSNKWLDEHMESTFGHLVQHKCTTRGPQVSQGGLISHGPSRSWTEKIDFVHALPCATLPEECQFLFQRPRPGHWPKPKTLEYARQCPAFFVQQGPANTLIEVRVLQWRLSTTLIERQLMFDLNEVQMLVYILLKMMRVCYIKPQFDDNLSTFHFKTAMMFTIETHSPDIWRKDNIVACTTYCFNTLLRWIKLRYCPHFTTKGVNIFDGKLSRHELQQLESVIMQIRDNIVWYICNLEMDMFGLRIMDKMGIRVMPFIIKNARRKNIQKIQKKIIGNVSNVKSTLIEEVALQYNRMGPDEAQQRVTLQLQLLRSMQATGSDLEREAASLYIPYLYGYLASIRASLCIASNQPVTQDIHQLYHLSLKGDLMSGKLKYASMLYCSGQYAKAAQMLTHCEGLLGPDVAHYCGCIGREYEFQSERYLEKGLNTNIADLLRTSSTVCIKFSIYELPCVPEHLQYEMYRTQTQEDRKKRYREHGWMDQVVIDCQPFLYYLQFLVYTQMGQPYRQLKAMQNQGDYFTCLKQKQIRGHGDTAANVLAHCIELVDWSNFSNMAWKRYQMSIRTYPNNNAAWIHLIRLFRKHFV